MSTSGKRSHSRRSREYNVTEDSSEDSDSSASSTEYDWRDKKTKEKRSHRRPDDDDRGRSSYKKERRSKRDKKGSKEKKRKKKRKKKGTPEMLEGQDSDPLHQNKELRAKQSCLAFISSTRLTPTAASFTARYSSCLRLKSWVSCWRLRLRASISEVHTQKRHCMTTDHGTRETTTLRMHMVQREIAAHSDDPPIPSFTQSRMV